VARPTLPAQEGWPTEILAQLLHLRHPIPNQPTRLTLTGPLSLGEDSGGTVTSPVTRSWLSNGSIDLYSFSLSKNVLRAFLLRSLDRRGC
jgi:hypothetical protein